MEHAAGVWGFSKDQQSRSRLEVCLQVVADGLHILIGDPYNTPTVRVRRALSNEYEDVSPSPVHASVCNAGHACDGKQYHLASP